MTFDQMRDGIWAFTIFWSLSMIGLVAGAARGQAAERLFDVAPGAWSLEQFGTDVAVLRSPPASSGSGKVSILLACSADDRRIRFSFPEAFEQQLPGRQHLGSALITASGPSQMRFGVVVRFRVTDPATLVVGVSTKEPLDPVARIASILAAGARDLNLLVSWGPGPVLLTRLAFYRLSMASAGPQKADATLFNAACSKSQPRQDH